MFSRTEILVVADGSSRHIERFVAALADSHLQVTLAAFEAGDIHGVRFVRLGRLSPRADRRYFIAIPRLARLIASLRPVRVEVVGAAMRRRFRERRNGPTGMRNE